MVKSSYNSFDFNAKIKYRKSMNFLVLDTVSGLSLEDDLFSHRGSGLYYGSVFRLRVRSSEAGKRNNVLDNTIFTF